MPDQNISNWTVSTLTKFIKDVFKQDPVRFADTLKVNELTVERKLTVVDEVEFDALSDYRNIGGTGQPNFSSGWGNFGGGWRGAGFLKTPDGFVELTGLISGGTIGSAAFTLPPGFRPKDAIPPFAVLSNNALGRVDIGTDGTVKPASPSVNTWVSLAGIRFKAA